MDILRDREISTWRWRQIGAVSLYTTQQERLLEIPEARRKAQTRFFSRMFRETMALQIPSLWTSGLRKVRESISKIPRIVTVALRD